MKNRVYILMFAVIFFTGCINHSDEFTVEIPSNSPVISNVPGAFSYIENMRIKNDTYFKELEFTSESFVLSATVLNYSSGELDVEIASDTSKIPLSFEIRGNMVISEVLNQKPIAVKITSQNFSGAINIALAED